MLHWSSIVRGERVAELHIGGRNVNYFIQGRSSEAVEKEKRFQWKLKQLKPLKGLCTSNAQGGAARL
jgi:hypothetical protein